MVTSSSTSWRNACKRFIHDDFFGPLRLSPSNHCEVNLDSLGLLDQWEILERKTVTGLQPCVWSDPYLTLPYLTLRYLTLNRSMRRMRPVRRIPCGWGQCGMVNQMTQQPECLFECFHPIIRCVPRWSQTCHVQAAWHSSSHALCV
jgi:hypothetical protein